MKKQTKTTRVLAFLLILSLLVLAFAGCASSDKGGDATEAAAKGGSRTYQQYMEWLKQYDKWVDSYVNVCKNYQKNPMAYMSDYMSKTAELTEWTAKFADIEDDDDLTDAEALKVLAEYQRIYAKQLNALSELN